MANWKYRILGVVVAAFGVILAAGMIVSPDVELGVSGGVTCGLIISLGIFLWIEPGGS